MSASSAASSSLVRARIPIIVLTTLAAASGIYLLYVSHAAEPETPTITTGLHRSNAVHRRRRRTNTNPDDSAPLFTDSSGDNDEDTTAVRPWPDGETVVDDQDAYSWVEVGGGEPAGYQRNGQNIVQLLFRVSEDATRRNAYVHRGCACNGCGVVPIRGIRYRCANCADYDLCEGCESQGLHTKTHIFYKVRVPAPSFGPRLIQPVWYTGDPEGNIVRQLPKELYAKFSRETGFERPELDAYWEQWTFMANTEWRDDPDEIELAMDRKTFERCLVPSGGYRHAAPSLIFDRMFAFYDTNKDDLISFPEFLHGLSYKKKKDKWKRIFEGYDIDGDGYVDRKDFLRMFRSYYVLCRQMHRDMLEGIDEQQMSSTEAHRLVSGRQPLSSAFGEGGVRYPAAPDPRTGEGKTTLLNGDEEIIDGKGVINESSDDTGNREDVFKRTMPLQEIWSSRDRGNRGYWDAMLNPPGTVEQMPDVLRNLNRARRAADMLDQPSNAHPVLRMAEEMRDDESSSGSNMSDDNDENWPPRFVTITDEDAEAIEGAGTRVASIRRTNRSAVTAHAMQRERAQREITERWKRRHFYTDEEEGATAPADWKEDDDILAHAETNGESSKMPSRPSVHSRSSSKVRFAEEIDDFDTRSNPSTSSRSVPERWGGMEIPDAEKDAGKEILYQVTQQAFNELLDPLFKAKEDLALEAAETKALRERYRHLFTTPEFGKWAIDYEAEEEKKEQTKDPKTPTATKNPVWPGFPEVEVEQVSEAADLAFDWARTIEQVRERSLEELLDATGYSIEEEYEDEDEENNSIPSLGNRSPLQRSTSNRASSIPSTLNSPPQIPTSQRPSSPEEVLSIIAQYDDGSQSLDSTTQATPSSPSSSSSFRDPTLPQFRPNTTSTSTSNIILAPTPPSAIGSRNVQSDTDLLQTAINHLLPPPISPPPQTPQSEALLSSLLSTTSSHNPQQTSKSPSLSSEPTPSNETLYTLLRADLAEKEKEIRGGWGRLSCQEFEDGVRRGELEGRKNQMDYLGSWVEFCIP